MKLEKPWLPCLIAVALLGCKSLKEVQAERAGSGDGAAAKKVEPLGPIDAYPGAMEVKRDAYDEGGFHIQELVLSTPDSAEKVAAFYEPQIKAKAMPTTAGMMSIQSDYQGKHYEVDYGRFGSDTNLSILIKTPTGQ